jgi:tetratricopeptide (TPR) repeat protein
MVSRQALMKVLIIGENEELKTWLKQLVANHQLPWRIRYSCNLRALAPENQLSSQELIVVLWDPAPLVTIDEVIRRNTIDSRGVEGVMRELACFGSGELPRRVVIIGRGITREETIYLAEHNLGAVFSLPDNKAAWDRQAPNMLRRIDRLQINEIARRNNPEERLVSRFLQMLSVWDRVSDHMKMKATDQLLRALGDSARYAELLAKKCLAERNFQGAEQWLTKAITKNPNYFSAMQSLAEVYFELGKIDKCLDLLEKMKSSNPRNVSRLVKMGRCYVAKGDYHKAEKVLSDALCIDEFFEEAREELGRVKVILGDYEAARSLLKHTSRSKELAHFLNTVGIELVSKSRFVESIEHYKKAQMVIPGNDLSHLLFFNIGLAYAKWGRFTEARQYANLALVRKPHYDKAAQLLSRIDQKISA